MQDIEMLLFILTFLLAGALAQVTLDPKDLENIFGKPPTTPSGLETVTVKPTDATTTFVDKNGQACKCVPYYLCTADLTGEHVRNASVTGWGELDIRFGEEDNCQESVEKCCTEPKTEEEVKVPETDPVTLKGCGYRNPKGLDFTIKGGSGRESQFGEFPWVVALTALNDSYVGVGVLIHPQVVMTGAHIAYKYPNNMKIRAGEWDTQTTGERLKHQERIVQEMVIHPGFNKVNLFNDIALLRLAEPVKLAEHINVICLPSQDESFDTKKKCVANGWGKAFFGKEGSYAVILKKLEIDMVPNAQCQQLLRRTRLGNHFKLHNSFVCAGGEEGKDTCTGDGGAPLACPVSEDRYKLTGLVAWGIGCGGKDIPAVYAGVPFFRNWVDTHMKNWGYDTKGYTI
ncbi:unnamed protein product [Chilo suppressalis]|uniref:Peptidase S1 domain-containing protein n=1 Tax=Chilo suppressalis TaxID=168631 RepID=A0ABN8B6A8_CHISP|nr:unnamed protein product [Chilo suppressalis]